MRRHRNKPDEEIKMFIFLYAKALELRHTTFVLAPTMMACRGKIILFAFTSSYAGPHAYHARTSTVSWSVENCVISAEFIILIITTAEGNFAPAKVEIIHIHVRFSSGAGIVCVCLCVLLLH